MEKPQERQPAEDMCHFDVTIDDSDFALPTELVGGCTDKGQEDESKADSIDQGRGSLKSSLDGAVDGNEGTGAIEAARKRASKAEDKYYRGLPPNLKQYRTDYPDELFLRKICTPKPPGKRKTVDNYKTQPLANFVPVSSNERLGPIKKQESDRRSSGFPKSCPPTVRDLPPIVSVSDEAVIDYLENNNIQMMLEYFLGMCILHTPPNPFQYIADLADKLIKGRNDEASFAKIPRLLTPDHVQAMFRLYDRIGSGSISKVQYDNAMESMGLVKYNRNPDGYEADDISKETFVTSANQAINDLLKSFLFKKDANDC